MLRHIATWKLNGETAADVDGQVGRIKRELEALGAVVPEIVSIEVVRNMLNPGANFDAAVIVDVENEAGLQAYLEHPDHVAASTYIKSIILERAVIDFVV